PALTGPRGPAGRTWRRALPGATGRAAPVPTARTRVTATRPRSAATRTASLARLAAVQLRAQLGPGAPPALGALLDGVAAALEPFQLARVRPLGGRAG